MAWLQENWIIAVVGLVVAVVLLWWLFGRNKAEEIETPIAPSDEPKKPYFSAAMFYYENNLDLKKAAAWMDAAIAAQPGQMWMIYRKGLIHAKMGDKAGALAAAQESLELAKNDAKSPAALKEEYTRLNNALIASLK